MHHLGEDAKEYRIRSVDRAVEVLFAFSRDQPDLELSEISRITELSKTTAFRILVTLSLHNLVSYDEATRKYSLGFATLHLANIRRLQGGLQSVGRDVLRRLRDSLNETVSLSIRVGTEKVCIDQFESHHSYRRAPETGKPTPLYTGAPGKVLLAACTDDEIDAYLSSTELIPQSEGTITDPEVLRQQIRDIRAKGYAASYRERSANGTAFGAPVYGSNQDVVAAVHVSVPQERLTDELQDRCIAEVMAAARQITVELGG